MVDLLIQDADEVVGDAKPPKSDPKPGQKRRGRPPGSKASSTFAKEFGAELEALIRMGAMVWATRDPVCAPVLNAQAADIARDIAELAAGSAKARKYLESTLGVGKVVPLLMHVTPVLAAVRAHHLAPQDPPDGPPGAYTGDGYPFDPTGAAGAAAGAYGPDSYPPGAGAAGVR